MLDFGALAWITWALAYEPLLMGFGFCGHMV